ncbi:MAG: hypothetical protein ACRDGE_00685 [Candidatus Limnocylindria bacterium]
MRTLTIITIILAAGAAITFTCQTLSRHEAAVWRSMEGEFAKIDPPGGSISTSGRDGLRSIERHYLFFSGNPSPETVIAHYRRELVEAGWREVTVDPSSSEMCWERPDFRVIVRAGDRSGETRFTVRIETASC